MPGRPAGFTLNLKQVCFVAVLYYSQMALADPVAEPVGCGISIVRTTGHA